MECAAIASRSGIITLGSSHIMTNRSHDGFWYQSAVLHLYECLMTNNPWCSFSCDCTFCFACSTDYDMLDLTYCHVARVRGQVYGGHAARCCYVEMITEPLNAPAQLHRPGNGKYIASCCFPVPSLILFFSTQSLSPTICKLRVLSSLPCPNVPKNHSSHIKWFQHSGFLSFPSVSLYHECSHVPARTTPPPPFFPPLLSSPHHLRTSGSPVSIICIALETPLQYTLSCLEPT